MPYTSYAIQHALALGDEHNLGGLAISNAMCGQVLEIQCKSTATSNKVYSGPKVKAVVVSSCNIHAHNCGTDLIRKTWDLATTGATPGEADCTVSRTSTNPMTASGLQCFIRPDHSEGKSNAYFASAGVFNTGGKLVESLYLNGVKGNPNGISPYYDFHGSGFTNSATLKVEFKDGSTSNIPYANCQVPGQAYIWR